jgi:serine/threonine-protein kinase
MRTLLEWMLQPDPAARPASMADVAEWRSGAGTTLPGLDQRASSTQFGRTVIEEPEPRRRVRVGAIAAAALVVLVLAGMGAAIYGLDLWPRPEEELDVIASPIEQDEPPALRIEQKNESTPTVEEESQAEEPPIEPLPNSEGAGTVPGSTGANEPGEATHTPVEKLPDQQIEQPVQPPAEEVPLTRVAQITNYIREYDGGDCFFLASPAVVETGDTISANMEVFGASVEAASALDAGFRQANGFEAQIFLRPVNRQQCPAIDFLERVAAKPELAPLLSISAFQLRPGETLRGTIVAQDGRHAELLLVSGSGQVRNITDEAVPEGGGMSFALPMVAAASGGGEPQLLLVVTTDAPLDLPSASGPADAYFPLLLAEAQRTRQEVGVAVKYFRVEG